MRRPNCASVNYPKNLIKEVSVMSGKTKVVITDSQKTVKVPKGIRMIVRRSCIAALQSENVGDPGIVEVVFSDNESIRKLKRKYHGKDAEAGAMWLPDDTGVKYGTIVISMEKAQELADFYGCSLQKEVCYLTVHELLYLISHKKRQKHNKAEMQEKKETVMYQLGLPLSSAYTLNRV